MMHTSRVNISHLSTGKRKMQQNIAEQALKAIENGNFAVALLHQFSNGVTALSLLNGTLYASEGTLGDLKIQAKKLQISE